MQGTNPLTMQCTYSTPCGWCTKWDKKCDKNIEEPVKFNTDCEHEWECLGMSTAGSDYVCKKCHAHKFEPYASSSSSLVWTASDEGSARYD